MTEQLLKEILNEVKGIKTEISGIKSEISGMKSEISDIKTDISGMKSEMSSMRSEMTNMKLEITIMNSTLVEHTQLIRAIIDRQEETDAKLENLTMDVHKMHGDITFIKQELVEIKDEVRFTYQKTSKNELDIYKLKQVNEH